MIPRLWVCTSHPVLFALSLPLNPGVIFCLMAMSGLAGRFIGSELAARLRRLYQALAIVWALGVAFIAISGGIVVALGAHANSIFVGARYLWVGLAAIGLGIGGFLGQRACDALVTSGKWDERAQSVGAATWLGVVGLALYLPHSFLNENKKQVWMAPYEIADWAFDVATMDIASDECLAFRSVDDHATWFYPGDAAGLILDRYGKDAVPGISSYLMEQFAAGTSDSASIVGLLATVAHNGDFPVLHVYDSMPFFRTREMRECARNGHPPRRTSRHSYSCSAP